MIAAIYARKSTAQRNADVEMRSTARQIERAHAFAVPIGVYGELIDEQRVHVALLEVARVDPVVRARDLVATLRVRDDVAIDLEDQLLDAFFLSGLCEFRLGDVGAGEAPADVINRLALAR